MSASFKRTGQMYNNAARSRDGFKLKFHDMASSVPTVPEPLVVPRPTNRTTGSIDEGPYVLERAACVVNRCTQLLNLFRSQPILRVLIKVSQEPYPLIVQEINGVDDYTGL